MSAQERRGAGAELRRAEGAEDGFLQRWSRRKRAVDDQNEPAAPPPELEAAPPEEETDEAALERLGLPDPDALKPGDDVSGFMARSVPSRLRNRALRKLWVSNPVLANLDELVDYGEDFTDAATVIENLTTAYQVGRGFRDPDEETPPAAAEAAPPPADADDHAEALAEPSDAPTPSEAETASLAEAPAADPVDGFDSKATARAAADSSALPGRERQLPLDAETMSPPRRIRFEFGDSGA
ncbi:MAG: DUF3306 domain-containing protein [Pseudomonadota bacterium]